MALDLDAALDQIETLIDATALVNESRIGEPSSITAPLTAAVFWDSSDVVETTLDRIQTRWTATLRLYTPAMSDAREVTEKNMQKALAQVREQIVGDFQLGHASVRNVEVTGMRIDFGYQTVGTVLYRIADLAIPMLINDEADTNP